MKKEILKVVFKKFDDGQVIAFFPQFAYKRKYTIESYMFIGGHDEADPLLARELKTATVEEYEPLLNQIKSIYHEYDVQVLKKLMLSKIKYQ